MATRTASCVCGKLKVTVSGEPARTGICNCTKCQRRTGAPFGVSAFFPKDQIVAIEGAPRIFRRSSDSGRNLQYHFCPDCGSTVFWYLDMAPQLVGIGVGCFADPSFPMPTRAIWAAHKHHWVEFPAAVPVLDEQPA